VENRLCRFTGKAVPADRLRSPFARRRRRRLIDESIVPRSPEMPRRSTRAARRHGCRASGWCVSSTTWCTRAYHCRRRLRRFTRAHSGEIVAGKRGVGCSRHRQRHQPTYGAAAADFRIFLTCGACASGAGMLVSNTVRIDSTAASCVHAVRGRQSVSVPSARGDRRATGGDSAVFHVRVPQCCRAAVCAARGDCAGAPVVQPGPMVA